MCQQHAHLPAKAPIHTWEWPKNSWDRVHVDYAGSIQGSMILVLIDAYSKWIEAHVVSSSTSEVTIEHLSQIFATHGLPKSIVSDNGSCFTSDDFSKFVKQNGIQHYTNSSLLPSLQWFGRGSCADRQELCEANGGREYAKQDNKTPISL